MIAAGRRAPAAAKAVKGRSSRTGAGPSERRMVEAPRRAPGEDRPGAADRKGVRPDVPAGLRARSPPPRERGGASSRRSFRTFPVGSAGRPPSPGRVIAPSSPRFRGGVFPRGHAFAEAGGDRTRPAPRGAGETGWYRDLARLRSGRTIAPGVDGERAPSKGASCIGSRGVVVFGEQRRWTRRKGRRRDSKTYRAATTA